MISYDYKFIFVHIPKCAGGSIEKALFLKRPTELLFGFPNKYQEDGLQHLTAQQIKSVVPADIFSSYFKFVFVRNPWDKVVSQLHYAKQKRPGFMQRLGLNQNSSLKDYLNSMVLAKVHPHWEYQYKFVYQNNECLVDFIGKYENLHNDYHVICDKLELNFPRELPHVNKSKHKHYTEYYDEETKQIVAKKYRKDIEYFGYEFGD